MDKVRYGIVGCGVIFPCHADSILAMPDIAELVAVCDINPEKLKAAVEKYRVKGYADYHEMMADPNIDAVTVCVPSGLHGDVAIAAMNAGKHALSEKPIDITLAKADQMIAAAKANKVTLGVISNTRYTKGPQQLHKWLDEGKLGTLYYGEAAVKWYRTQEYYDSGDWRGTWELDGGGALTNQGVHFVDQLRWAMGRPKSVMARMATLGHDRIEVEDVVSATIEFENGALGSLMATTCAYPGFELRLEVYGSKGSVRIVNEDIEAAVFTDGTEFKAGAVELSGATASQAAQVSSPTHFQQINDYTHALMEGREPYITAQDGRNAIEVIMAVYESARTGKAVEL